MFKELIQKIPMVYLRLFGVLVCALLALMIKNFFGLGWLGFGLVYAFFSGFLILFLLYFTETGNFQLSMIKSQAEMLKAKKKIKGDDKR